MNQMNEKGEPGGYKLMQQPYNSPWINFRKRSHFFNTNIIKCVKKSVKMDVENICVI